MATKLQQEYLKQEKRVKRFLREASKRGYKFEDNLVPERPKRITKKSLERIKNLTPDKLYEKSSYYDPILDKTVSGTEERRLTRSRASKKAAQTRRERKQAAYESEEYVDLTPSLETLIIDNIYDLIHAWQPIETWEKSYTKLKERDKNILERILDGAISNLGRNQVARNLQSHANELPDLIFHILYGSSDFKWGNIQGDIAAITAIIYGRRLTVVESKNVQEYIDYEEDYDI